MTAADGRIPPGVDPTRPSVGRLYDYYLGGSEYLEVDRLAAEHLRKVMPELEDGAWANRGFLQRAAKFLAEHGVRQFIDIGAGLPTRNNTHQTVQAVTSDARVVYVDNDPMIAARAKELVADSENTVFIDGDLRDPDSILGHPELRGLIDFEQPVGLMLVAIMHCIGDADDPHGLVARYLQPLAAGSWLALSHATGDNNSPTIQQRLKEIYSRADGHSDGVLRSKPEVEQFFAGLELVPPYAGAEPAVTYLGAWGAEDPGAADSEGSRWGYCGVARKL